MANVKITELTALTDPASSDVLPIVDVGADTTKKVTIADLLENAGDGAAATPAFSFDNDKNTGIYRPGADQLALVTGGTARLTVSTSAVTSALPVDVLLGSASTPSFTFTGDLNTGIYSPGANQLAISTGGTGRLFVDSSGNVGVGTTSPENYGSGFVTVEARGTSADGGGIFQTRSYDASVKSYYYCDSSTDTARIGTVTNHPFLFVTNTAERMRIDSSGDVQARRARSNTSGDVALSIQPSDSTLHYGFRIDSANNNLNLDRADNNSTLLTVSYAGNVGIGTTPVNTLDVNGTGRFRLSGNNLEITTEGGAPYLKSEQNAALHFGTNSQLRATIDSSGRLLVGTVTSPAYQLQLQTDSAGKPSTNTWTIVSDERIKEEIELADLDLCYEAVKNIPLKRFKWKDEVYTEEQAYDRRKLGWIAQDVEAVFPKAVRQHEFKYNQIFEEVVIPAVPAELDDDGNIITEEQPERIEKGELISEDIIEDCRDLNSDQIYAAMYGAIQKLISKVELLEAEVQALKTA